jgi:hypothetical protein
VTSVLFWSPGYEWRPSLERDRPGGGSEVHLSHLVEGYVAAGHRVTILGPYGGPPEDGVTFVPVYDGALVQEQRCDLLVVCGPNSHPDWIKARRAVALVAHGPEVAIPGFRAEPICVSDYQADLWRKAGYAPTVIPCFVPDDYHDLASVSKDPRRFINASPRNKGADVTLYEWAKLRERLPGAELVWTCGYDAPPPEALKTPGVRWLGKLPPRQLAMEIAKSAGLFHASTSAETFFVVAAIAEIARVRCHILCKHFGAIRTTVNSPLVTMDPEQWREDMVEAFDRERVDGAAPGRFYAAPNDYRFSTLMPRWLELVP